jgi:hypothetical protein
MGGLDERAEQRGTIGQININGCRDALKGEGGDIPIVLPRIT